jgi:hypothetical protein
MRIYLAAPYFNVEQVNLSERTMEKQSSEEFSDAGGTCWPSEMEKFAETEAVRNERTF